MVFQHGPDLLMLKYWASTMFGTAGGGTGRWVKSNAGTARRTNSPTNFSEHTFTSWGVCLITVDSPALDRISRIHRPGSARWRVSTLVDQKYGVAGRSGRVTHLVGSINSSHVRILRSR